MGLLSAIKDKAGSVLHGAEDVAKGATKAVGDVARGAEKAAGDVFHGTVDAVKTAAQATEKTVGDVAHGMAQGAHEVAEGARTGHLLSGLVKGEQAVAHGAGEGLSDAWHGTTDTVGKLAGTGMKAVKDVGTGVSHAYDSGLDGVARATTDVAGKNAGDMVRTVGDAVAKPVRDVAQFQYGLTNGLGKGVGGIVRSTGDLVVGAVRVGSDSEYRDKLIADVGKTAQALGKLGSQALKDPGGTARKLGQAAEGAIGNVVESGKEAAARGEFAEWAGEGVGEVTAQVASMVVAPEAEGAAVAANLGRGAEMLGNAAKGAEALNAAGKGAEALTLAGRGAEALTTAGKGVEVLGTAGKGAQAAGAAGKGVEAAGEAAKVAGTAERAGAGGLETLATRDKHEFVLVDSGSGGAMTAGKLEGTVPQVAATYPLPLGSKPPDQAISATAAMILDPMIHPVAGAGGEMKVADHVIIACNSASVRAEDAIPKIKAYVADVKANPAKYDLAPEYRANTEAVADAIERDPGFLEKHVHEVAKPTAARGAREAAEALTGPNGAAKPDFFVRVDSTNGTVQSGSYQDNMRSQLENVFGDQGFKLQGEPARSQVQAIAGPEHEPAAQISHQVLTFRNEAGDTRRVFIENRGDPDWVPAIEDDLLGRDGSRLVDEADGYSAQAVNKLGADFPADAKAVFNGAPDLNMMCCTHYPAMQESLANSARAPGSFLNQADVVKGIVDGDIRGGAASVRVAEREANGPLTVVQTMGSRAKNAEQYLKTEGKLADPLSNEGIRDINARKGVIKRVIDNVRGDGAAKVEIKVPTNQLGDPLRTRENAFEQLHRHMAMEGGTPSRIAGQQGYRATYDVKPNGELTINSAGRLRKTSGGTRTGLVRPRPVQDLHPGVAAAMGGPARAQIGRLARLGTTGEQRGIAVLATRVDTGAQLQAAAGQLGSVVMRNAGKAEAERESVGILTGFQVINKETRAAMGGENDGPAGAVVMAKGLLDRGTPVSLVTDTGSERAVRESLVGAGLADPVTLQPTNNALKLHVADIGKETKEGYTGRIKEELGRRNMSTLVSIERPSPNTEGLLNNMGGQDITPHNADLSGLLAKGDGWQPYTIGIGDGGNELGLGGLHEEIKGLRLPNMERAVKNGERIAANRDFPADAVVLNSVSNNGGVALSMATRAATGARGFEQDVGTYDDVIRHLFNKGISTDGVKQKNLLSVDGRALGSTGNSARNPARMPGQDDATHHDMFREMVRIMDGQANP